MTNKEAIYRQDVLDLAKKGVLISNGSYKSVCKAINEIPPVNPQPCEDAISRQAVLDILKREGRKWGNNYRDWVDAIEEIKNLSSVNPTKTGHCKDCKYFEYDSVAKVDGVPLIVAHEICSRWGDGCKTKEGGYCFLFEPQERSDKE